VALLKVVQAKYQPRRSHDRTTQLQLYQSPIALYDLL